MPHSGCGPALPGPSTRTAVYSAWIKSKQTGEWTFLASAARLHDLQAAVEEMVRRDHLPRRRVRLSMDDRPPHPSTSLRLPRGGGAHFFGAGSKPAPRRSRRHGHR
jgi:hypothetical protein